MHSIQIQATLSTKLMKTPVIKEPAWAMLETTEWYNPQIKFPRMGVAGAVSRTGSRSKIPFSVARP